MNPEDKKHYRSRILDDIVTMRIKVTDLEEITQPISPDKGLGRLSRLEAMNDKSVNEAALNQARARLERLETAMGRVNNRDFGKCLKCAQPIAAERLELLPESTLCVDCAS